MKSILIIGGAGYIGSHTVVELADAGYIPIILDNFSNSDQSVIKGIAKIIGYKPKVYIASFQDRDILTYIAKKESINGVVHFAAYKAVGESTENPLKYYDNNVAGLIKLIDSVLKNKVNHFIFSSSAAVYGTPTSTRVTEKTPCKPDSPYGWTKYMGEVILQDACSANPHFASTALRYFNVIGCHRSGNIGELPKGRPQNLLPIITQATAGITYPLTIFGTDYPTPDGTCLRDYIHVVDLAKAHVAALNNMQHIKQDHGFKTYNIGTGKPTSVKELINTFEQVNKVSVPHKIGKRRVGDPVAYYASVRKAHKELNWETELTIRDAVKDAWAWQKSLNRT